MTLPWKVLVLSIAVMVTVEAYEINVLAEWFYTRALPPSTVSWQDSGAHRGAVVTTLQWLMVLGLANVIALAWHVARGRLSGAKPE